MREHLKGGRGGIAFKYAHDFDNQFDESAASAASVAESVVSVTRESTI